MQILHIHNIQKWQVLMCFYIDKAKEKSFDFSFGAASILFDPIKLSCLLKWQDP